MGSDDDSAIRTPDPDAIELSDDDDNNYEAMAVDVRLVQQRKDELRTIGRGTPGKGRPLRSIECKIS